MVSGMDVEIVLPYPVGTLVELSFSVVLLLEEEPVSDAELEEPVVVTGTGITVMPSDPVDVLKLYDPLEIPVPLMVDEDPVTVAETEATPVVCAARDEAALDRIPENSDANELETAASVTVATMLESSALSEDAIPERADVMPVLMGPYGFVPLPLLDAEDRAEEAALEISDATEDTKLETGTPPEAVP